MSDEAATWVVRLADPGCDAAQRAAFEAWRDADPRHEVAYEREAAAWEALDRLRALRPAGAGAPDPDLLAPARPRAFVPSRMAAGIAAAAVLVAGVGGAGLFATMASPAYATAIGERRVVQLRDGTRVELNTDSRIVVRYRNGRRRIDLVRGEALFDVARGASPLVIHARDRTLDAAGGQVAVRLDAARVDVTVKAGTVAVAGGAALGAGSVALYGPGAPRVEKVSDEQIERSLAWRQGAIAFEGQSLSDAAREINRYNRVHVVVADPSIARLRLAGYFQSDDPGAFVQAVVRTFPVRATTAADGSYQLTGAG